MPPHIGDNETQITAQAPSHFPPLNPIRVASAPRLDHKVDGPFVLTCFELKVSILQNALSYDDIVFLHTIMCLSFSHDFLEYVQMGRSIKLPTPHYNWPMLIELILLK